MISNNIQYVPISVQSMNDKCLLNENELLCFIGAIAGECYLADISDNKCIARAINCIKRGHHSPWEHYNISLKCIVDRGTSHAIVRHRHCAFQQSSTIYHKYIDGLIIIDNNYSDIEKDTFAHIFSTYTESLQNNATSRARDVLPNAMATNIIITTNIRQWVYMIQRRNGPGDSENMHIWCKKVREWFEEKYPTIIKEFDAWYEKHPL